MASCLMSRLVTDRSVFHTYIIAMLDVNVIKCKEKLVYETYEEINY